ncbi:MAG: hypothetical protein DWH94_08935, partial [Planctomycetota bacterium]
ALLEASILNRSMDQAYKFILIIKESRFRVFFTVMHKKRKMGINNAGIESNNFSFRLRFRT